MSHPVTAPAAYSHLTRVELLDHVNQLLQFAKSSADADTAMGLMRWNKVTAAELNARRSDPNRPIYRPGTRYGR